jgi:alkaline phosphatase D
MAADDHEIRDNWPKDSIPPGAPNDLRELLRRSADWARLLFIEHQRSHGPDAPPWAPSGDGERLWYAFDVGPFPFFCFDTRFERTEDGKRMMDSHQLDRFASWLDRRDIADVPKFVLSGSVMTPTDQEFARFPAHARRADTWAGYPQERLKVLDLILDKRAQNVVFISGDLHCAALASLQFRKATDLRCYAVVAPALYAPFPFANLHAREIAETEPIGSGIECVSRKKWDISGFALISVTPPPPGNPLDWEIRVEYHTDAWDRNGRPTSRLAHHGTLKNGQVV